VTVLDAEAKPGGRLRHEFSEKELPPKTLEAEIAVIFKLGVEYRPQVRVGQDVTLPELCQQFDAVLVACGPIEKAEVQRWGLKAAARGIDCDKGTYETGVSGVFAAGHAVRGKSLVVRSVADGKEAAHAMSQYLAGKPITPVHRPFSSRILHDHDGDLPEFLTRAASLPRRDAAGPPRDFLTLPIASQQSQRCLSCGCVAQGDCRLERYAALYGAETHKYFDGRRAFVQVNRNGSVIYEPGKCINCELCVQIAAEAQGALGLSFVGRGFDVRVGVPFNGTLEEGLGEVAAKCVAARPTGALYFSTVGQRCASCET
jgi:ferredoxin